MGTGWERAPSASLAARQRVRKVAAGDEEGADYYRKDPRPIYASLDPSGPLYSSGVFQWLPFLFSNVALARPASLLSPWAILLSFTALCDYMILILFSGFKDHIAASAEADASIPVSYFLLHYFSRTLQGSFSWMATDISVSKHISLDHPPPSLPRLLVPVLADGLPRPLLTLETHTRNLDASPSFTPHINSS